MQHIALGFKLSDNANKVPRKGEHCNSPWHGGDLFKPWLNRQNVKNSMAFIFYSRFIDPFFFF